MVENIGKTYLSDYYREIAGGNSYVRHTLKRISRTARQIDPSCPYGAHGILGSLEDYGFSSKEMEKFFRLCDSDVLAINAVDYCIFRGKLEVQDLRKAIKNNFKDFNLAAHVQFAIRDSHSFSQYYNPRIPKFTAT